MVFRDPCRARLDPKLIATTFKEIAAQPPTVIATVLASIQENTDVGIPEAFLSYANRAFNLYEDKVYSLYLFSCLSSGSSFER